MVDAVNAPAQLDRFAETVRQVALADRLVASKLDIAGPGALEALRARLAALNPSVPLIAAHSPDLDPVDLLITDIHDSRSKSREVERWMHAADDAAAAGDAHDPHSASIAATGFTFDAALDWTAFGVWMSMLLHRHGDRVLRMKGLLNVAGVPGPVLVNGVQHLVHPPAHLDRWPDEDRRSRIVVISSGLDREVIERSLHAFNALANPLPEPAGGNSRDTTPPIRGRPRSYAGAGAQSATRPVYR